MNSDGDKVYKEIVAEHNMKRQKKDKIYKTSSIVSRGMFYVASVLLIRKKALLLSVIILRT